MPRTRLEYICDACGYTTGDDSELDSKSGSPPEELTCIDTLACAKRFERNRLIRFWTEILAEQGRICSLLGNERDRLQSQTPPELRRAYSDAHTAHEQLSGYIERHIIGDEE
jgi:hypothetical protein